MEAGLGLWEPYDSLKGFFYAKTIEVNSIEF